MGSHSYIEKEDMGLSILGTPQYTYTVNGLHRQDYQAAIFQATLCRTAALESSLAAYQELVKGRQTKIDDLGVGLAEISRCMKMKEQTKDAKSTDKFPFDSTIAAMLRKYGFDCSSSMSYEELSPLQEDVKYAIDKETNELNQDTSDIQNLVAKRDDSFGTVGDFMDKIAGTRSSVIKYLGS